ncbi:hypothetical protein AYL99_09379 [Fonsecaea erecta]|uniref:Uncharacterized protein n=1 Tax=Fonsecaea erecta TaxID=1367422 RepID=A0A178Z8T0_9EURO|nr:hypothetical protein AYL99_09379 [Fonsecaea erecta]OAP56200.1 hypothetical protein AYL99_09379 [Fonsecaea erecta]
MSLMGRSPRLVIINNNDGHNTKKSKGWLIAVIVLSSISLFCGILAMVLRMLARRRARGAKDQPSIAGPSEESTNLADASIVDSRQKEHPYYKSTGYEATPDQNQTLLGNDERDPVTRWDSDSGVAAGVQRPESIASSYNAPPPRYE